MSNMKVGSSPLYFIPGQEELLENFTQHLNGREQEALSLLKEKKILNDEEQEPVTRVALRSIKDFAIPIKVRIENEQKIFWKYFTTEESEAKSLIQKSLSGTEESKEEIKPKQTEEPKSVEKPIEEPKPIEPTKIEKPEPSNPEPEQKHAEPETKSEEPKPEQVEEEAEEPKPVEKPKKKPKVQIHEFPENIKEHLAARDIEIIEQISEKKKEFVSKIRIDTMFGKQEYYLIAKDKKKINENDLTLALQKAQNEKMPALVMTRGELDKKSKAYLRDWQNLIKFEKLNF